MVGSVAHSYDELEKLVETAVGRNNYRYLKENKNIKKKTLY